MEGGRASAPYWLILAHQRFSMLSSRSLARPRSFSPPSSTLLCSIRARFLLPFLRIFPTSDFAADGRTDGRTDGGDKKEYEYNATVAAGGAEDSPRFHCAHVIACAEQGDGCNGESYYDLPPYIRWWCPSSVRYLLTQSLALYRMWKVQWVIRQPHAVFECLHIVEKHHKIRQGALSRIKGIIIIRGETSEGGREEQRRKVCRLLPPIFCASSVVIVFL